MRLLNTKSITLKDFIHDQTRPEYAILSHTWESDEVLYRDIINGVEQEKLGYKKLWGCCKKAKKDGFEWVWIDTCCIDKESSAELSEAINSMFKWYKSAAICYAYLADTSSQNVEDALTSRWFTRGWTLQELIAPPVVEFYSHGWEEIGTKSTLSLEISMRTSIPIHVLLGSDLSLCSVAEKMSWAGGRETTRVEDIAYCLLGVFDVNMPMLYGEGAKAFLRLQQEILNQTMDYSIFAWNDPTSPTHAGFLASSPAAFEKHIINRVREGRAQYQFQLPPLPDAFSVMSIGDFAAMQPIEPYNVKPVDVYNNDQHPPMLTSWGLRTTALVSEPHPFGRFVFLNLKYEFHYLCVLESNSLRSYSACLFGCDIATIMSQFRYTTLYMNVKRSPAISDSSLQQRSTLCWVQLKYRRSYEGFTITLQSGSSLSSYWALWESPPAKNLFSYPQFTNVIGAVSFKIASADDVDIQYPEYRISVLIGHGLYPWCVIDQSGTDVETLRRKCDTYIHNLHTHNFFNDRDARYLQNDLIVAASFRRTTGKQGGDDITHQLTIAVHPPENFPTWVVGCAHTAKAIPFLE